MFIEEHRQEFDIPIMCRLLAVSRSGYYVWRQRQPSAREMADAELLLEIEKIFAASGQTYGSPRIFIELKAQGIGCGRKRVERLMRENGLKVPQKRKKRVVTTDSDHAFPVAPNLLDRNFTAEKPNEKWVTDISYIRTDTGWLYLAVVMDLFSRCIVGWAMRPDLSQTLVLSALQMAVANRQPAAGLLHHSDRGSQYCSLDYLRLQTEHKMVTSMSRKGNCYDNAAMESFFATLKNELVDRRHYRNQAEARRDIFAYIEGFYNRRRRHSTLGFVSPIEFEKADALCFN
jgi:transposase InsO family protein